MSAAKEHVVVIIKARGKRQSEEGGEKSFKSFPFCQIFLDILE